MKKTLVSIIFISITVFSLQAAPKKLVLKSPNGKLVIKAEVNTKGQPVYNVKFNNKEVILQSALGLATDNADFTKNVAITQVSETTKFQETYSSPAEKRASRTFVANCASLKLTDSNKKVLTIEFRAANEGVAFRYLANDRKPIAVKSEKTSFKFPTTAKGWLHPHANVKEGWCETQPSYEEQYEYNVSVGTKSPLVAGWSFPALFQTNGNWVLITEAGLTPDYVGSRLSQDSPYGEYSIGFPQKGETMLPNDPEYPVSATIVSPWRVIVVGSLATIVESQMVSDFAPSADKKTDYGWVKPGFSSWSWGVLHDESVNYEVSKQFIDYASEMTWEYCLVDADWDRRIGYEKIEELAHYATSKNVGLVLWYNSSGAWNSTVYTPKSALIEREARRKEFERIHNMGVKGIKVDFWPGDGQSTIQYYYDMLQDAADFKLLVNFHGTTVPRGWSRTFPNLVSMESIRGFEFTTFEQKDTDLAPKHLTMMPFARNVVGPMDFTPVCFGEIVGKNRRTSNGFEIALSVVLQSGVQHFVEIPESMSRQPAYVIDFMKKLPRYWEDVKLIEGFPGKYVVMARKSGDKWYLAGINSQSETLKLTLDLSVLNIGSKAVTIITDGENNRSFNQKQTTANNNKLVVEILPNGGFVTVL
jgi:hypothetical protein